MTLAYRCLVMNLNSLTTFCLVTGPTMEIWCGDMGLHGMVLWFARWKAWADTPLRHRTLVLHPWQGGWPKAVASWTKQRRQFTTQRQHLEAADWCGVRQSSVNMYIHIGFADYTFLAMHDLLWEWATLNHRLLHASVNAKEMSRHSNCRLIRSHVNR